MEGDVAIPLLLDVPAERERGGHNVKKNPSILGKAHKSKTQGLQNPHELNP